MPDSDNFLPVQLVHATKEVDTTAIDAPNLPRHRLRYGPKEIRATRDETGKNRDPTRGGDPESLHYVPRPRQTGGKCTSMSVAIPPPASTHTTCTRRLANTDEQDTLQLESR